MSRYIELTTTEAWQEALQGSAEQALLIFKHSTSCSVSADAIQEYEAFLEQNSKVKSVLVKVIESRPVSNQIAEDLGIQHQSPQAILVNNNEVVWHTSHWHIKQESLAKAISSL